MTEDERVRRFQADIDEILDVGQASPREDRDRSDTEMLDTAARLAQTDFSAESRVRESLRRDVTRRSAGDRSKKPFPWLPGLLAPRSFILGPATAVLVMLVIMLAWPGAVATAAETIERLLRQVVLDESTSVRQVDGTEGISGLDEIGLVFEDDPTIFEQGGAVIWIAKTTIRERGDLPPDLPLLTESQVFLDIAGAREQLDFPLREPDELPDGYSLAQVRVTPTGWALIRYRGPDGPIVIAHVPQDPGADLDSGRLISTTVEILTDSPIEQVTVNGRAAAWVEGQSLSWVDGGVAYTLSGGRLSLTQAVRVAESMR